MKVTKQDVIEYFKDAKIIEDKYGDIAIIKDDFESRIYNDYGTFYLKISDVENFDTDLILYSLLYDRYAQIIEYKQQPTNMEKLLTEVRDLLLEEKQNREKLQPLGMTLAEAEQTFYKSYSGNSRLNITKTAKYLGVSRNTIYKWIELYNEKISE